MKNTKELLALVLTALFFSGAGTALGAEPPRFTVENKMPPFRVVNRTTTREVIVATSTRVPRGHTHTCPACKVTWDHDANSTHDCPSCHVEVSVRDRFAQPVTVFRREKVVVTTAGPAPAAPPQPVIQQRFTVAAAPVPQFRQTMKTKTSLSLFGSFISSGCANGNCAR